MYIQPHMRKQADVVRRTATLDSDGNLVAEDFNVVYGNHVVDLQPRELAENVANEQQQYLTSYFVFPELVHVMPFTRLGDYYRIGLKLYRITKRFDFVDCAYFETRDDATEQTQSIAIALQSRFVLDNLGPGVYTYGSGALAAVGPFSAQPILLDTLRNDGSYYIAAPSVTGFEIVDLGEGSSPLVLVQIKGVLA